jgi:lipoprotein-anchoring transpeptidase ErfK/SrfK
VYTLPGPKLWLVAGALSITLLILLGAGLLQRQAAVFGVALPVVANSLYYAPPEQQVAAGRVTAGMAVAQPSAGSEPASAPLKGALIAADAVLPSPTFTPPPTATPIPATQVVIEPTVAPTDVPAPSLSPLDPSARAEGERWIDVNLTAQTLTAYEGGTPLNTYVVSTGTWQYPTVTGQYHVYVKYVAADMSGPGYYLSSVPYIMYFYRGYGIHGTYWHNNFGTPMSHGCVNMRTEEAAWVFDWASVGTLVNVHY